jgi:hypothetical protein
MATEEYFCPHCQEKLVHRLGLYECPACDYTYETEGPNTPIKRSTHSPNPSRLEGLLRGTPPARELGDPEPLRRNPR